MSVADEFDVYLFPHDIPVNLATPEDLDRLREVFFRPGAVPGGGLRTW